MTNRESAQCKVTDCEKLAKYGRKGWCEGHYKKNLKYGDPLATGELAPNGLTRDELFIRKVDRTSDPDGCWRWLGKIDQRGKGYGQFTYRDAETGKPVSVGAHRYAYELWVGPIPEGLTIDHVWENGCRHTDCVRAPGHLEPVTPAEQNRRYYSRQTHCKHGHEFTPENIIWGGPNGRTRHCRECGRIRGREFSREHYVPHPMPLKTHCKNGHEFTPENTKMGGRLGTTRLCKQCARDGSARWKARQLALTSSD